ncbi:MAG: tyrosine-type recombinase/integrase [Bacillota bacterium]
MLTYSAGLRVSEVMRLKISDIDSDRMLIYIRSAKGYKDRHLSKRSAQKVFKRACKKVYSEFIRA